MDLFTKMAVLQTVADTIALLETLAKTADEAELRRVQEMTQRLLTMSALFQP